MMRLLPRLLFPALLAAIGLGWFGGQLGKWTDDYNIAFRDPATGASTWTLSWTPFRPLGTIIAYGKATWLWHHDTINHWISLGCHIFTTLMLWRLLRAFVRRRVVADLGAMFFLVCPLNDEMVFWCASAHACFAVGLTLALMLVYLRYARGASCRWLIPVMALMAYAIPCLYEQPAAVIPALPLLYFAITRTGIQSRTREWIRALLPVACALLACAGYVWRLKSGLPGNERGGANTIIAVTEWPGRVRQVWAPIAHSLLDQGMREFVAGSVWHGLSVLTGMAGWIAVALLMIAALVWLQHAWLPDERETASATPPVRAGVLVTLFGLAMVILPFAPIVAIREHGVATRMFYLPLAGLTLIATTWLDCILIEWIEPRRRVRLLKAAVGSIALLAVMLGAAGQVGVQDAFRRRFAMDAAQMRQLQSLVPAPPPGAILVPLRLNSYPTLTGFAAFDDFAISAFSTAWSSPAFVRHNYRRDDLHATDARFGAELPLRHWSHDSLRYFSDQYPRLEGTPHEGYRLPFDRMIPFIVDWDGQVKRVDTVRILAADNTTREVQFPLAAEADRAHLQISRTIQVQNGELPSDNTLGPWRLIKTGQRLPVSNHVEWGAKNASMTLQSDGSSMSMMEAELSPSSDPRKLRFLMAVSESDLRYVQSSGEIQLLFRLDNRQLNVDSPTFRIAELRHLQTWIPIELNVPPQTTSNRLIVEVRANQCDLPPRIRLTPGKIVQ